MKRAILVVLLLAGTVGAQSDKNIGKAKPVKPGDVLVVSPTNTLTQIDIYLRRNSDGHLIYSKNGGPEFDIDEAYDRLPNLTTGEFIPYINGVSQFDPKNIVGGSAPKRTGEFHPQCRYKLDNGDSEVGDCPEVGEIHLKNGEHHEIDCTKDPCVGY